MSFRPFGVVCLFSLALGCGSSESPQLKEWRDKFVLKACPESPMTIAEAITHTPDDEIAIIAQVGSGKGDTFDNQVASFLISEAPDKDHMGKPGHDEDCPFCKLRLANAPTVAVGFETAQGKPIPVDARKLFGIKKGDVVVVLGKGTYEEANKMLSFRASGMHVVGR